MQYAIVITEY